MTLEQLEKLKQTINLASLGEKIDIAKFMCDFFKSSKECKKNYQDIRIILILDMFDKYMKDLPDSFNNDELKDILFLYNSLSDDSKDKIIKNFINNVKMVDRQEYKKHAADICENEGHCFHIENDGWNKYDFQSWENVVCEDGILTKLVDHFSWERECLRCGFVEALIDEEPKTIAFQKVKLKEKDKV